MEILPAEEKDAKEIVAIILEEFSYSKINEEKFLKKLKRKNIRAFKVVEKGKIIGLLELEKIDYATARINGLSIKPEFRGKGFGKELLEFATEFSRKKGIKRILLLVKQSNAEAKKLYEEAGFKFMGLLENKIDNETIEELELNLHEEDEETPSYIG